MNTNRKIKLGAVSRENLSEKEMKRIWAGKRMCPDFICDCNSDSSAIGHAEMVDNTAAILNPSPTDIP